MPAHTGRLLLTPHDPLQLADTKALQQALREAQFIGEPLPGGNLAFLAGEQFLSLITFAGCSVQIELLPPSDGRGFCHVRFIGPFEHPTLIHGRNTRPPRCPVCRAQQRDWKTLLPSLQEMETEKLPCSTCTAKHPARKWDWKGNAGFGRTFISVEEIFPGEATPAPALSAVLKQASGNRWRHFYVQDD